MAVRPLDIIRALLPHHRRRSLSVHRTGQNARCQQYRIAYGTECTTSATQNSTACLSIQQAHAVYCTRWYGVGRRGTPSAVSSVCRQLCWSAVFAGCAGVPVCRRTLCGVPVCWRARLLTVYRIRIIHSCPTLLQARRRCGSSTGPVARGGWPRGVGTFADAAHALACCGVGWLQCRVERHILCRHLVRTYSDDVIAIFSRTSAHTTRCQWCAPSLQGRRKKGGGHAFACRPCCDSSLPYFPSLSLYFLFLFHLPCIRWKGK